MAAGFPFWRFACCCLHCSCASSSCSRVVIAECSAKVRRCISSSLAVKLRRMRSISDCWPRTKLSQGCRFLNAVMAELSDHVNATNGRPCLDAGRKRLLPARCMTEPSLIVKPCAFIHCQCEPCNCRKLCACHARALLVIRHWQDRHPLWLLCIEGLTAVIG